MRKSRFTEEQQVSALRQAEAWTPVGKICRKLQVTEATFYWWKKKFGGLGVPELLELRQLREENGRLKRLVADLSVDREVHQEARKQWCPETPRITQLGDTQFYARVLTL